MPQLHVYVSDAIAREARRRAEAEGLSVSRYLARLVQREIGPGWPDGYFESVVGAWEGEPLERAPQGEPESRDPIRTSPARATTGAEGE
jgi:hypothetical protein